MDCRSRVYRQFCQQETVFEGVDVEGTFGMQAFEIA